MHLVKLVLPALDGFEEVFAIAYTSNPDKAHMLLPFLPGQTQQVGRKYIGEITMPHVPKESIVMVSNNWNNVPGLVPVSNPQPGHHRYEPANSLPHEYFGFRLDGDSKFMVVESDTVGELRFDAWLTLSDVAPFLALGNRLKRVQELAMIDAVQFHKWEGSHAMSCLVRNINGESYTGMAVPANGLYDEKQALSQSFQIAAAGALKGYIGSVTRDLSNIPWYNG